MQDRNIHVSSGVQGAPLDWLIAPARVFTHPNEVLQHPDLTHAERRAILASWASDARAVEDYPWLRQLDSGAQIELKDILEALRVLDDEAAHTEPQSHRRAGRFGWRAA